MNRRFFLKSSGLALIGTALTPNVFARMAAGTRGGSKKVLVTIFQRGAVDGLNVIVPYGEAAYFKTRPSIAIARPGASDGALDLDGFFGAHPALAPLLPHFRNRNAAFVHAAGSAHATRSHFDAQDFMECGTPGERTTRDGFLARAVETRTNGTPLRAVAIAPTMPRILTGSANALSMPDLARYGLRGDAATLEAMYGPQTFAAAKILKAADPTSLTPANGAVYPDSPLGRNLRQIAQLIRADVGLEVAFTDVSGWDTHAGEGGAQGQLANSLRPFAQAIAAFAQDLGSRMSEVVLVTTSEFGRTVRENGNRGTDHGHGTVMMVLGGQVRGGRVYGKWPGLDALHDDRDLAVTTDFRHVFSEVLTRHLGIADLTTVFPGLSPKPLGLFA